MSRQVKDPVLEAYLAESLDAEARAKVDQLLTSSPEDRQRVDELRAESQAFLIQHPRLTRLPEPESPWSRWWSRPWFVLPLAAAVAAALFFIVTGDSKDPDVLVKGTQPLGLRVHRQTPGGSEELRDADVLHPGDAVRFSAEVPRAGYVAVFIGEAALVPAHDRLAAPVRAGVSVLEGAAQLDDDPGPEQFTLVWSAEPFSVGEARATIGKSSVDAKWQIVRRAFSKRR